MKDKAYICNKKDCSCQDINNFVRHCPKCGELYLFDENNLAMLCVDCDYKHNVDKKMSDKEKRMNNYIVILEVGFWEGSNYKIYSVKAESYSNAIKNTLNCVKDIIKDFGFDQIDIEYSLVNCYIEDHNHGYMYFNKARGHVDDSSRSVSLMSYCVNDTESKGRFVCDLG